MLKINYLGPHFSVISRCPPFGDEFAGADSSRNIDREGDRVGLKSLTLSLPRLINIKYLLQPHHKYYITQYGELGFP